MKNAENIQLVSAAAPGERAAPNYDPAKFGPVTFRWQYGPRGYLQPSISWGGGRPAGIKGLREPVMSQELTLSEIADLEEGRLTLDKLAALYPAPKVNDEPVPGDRLHLYDVPPDA